MAAAQHMDAAYPVVSLGETAEIVADRWGITREEQDAFAVESQARAAAAIEAGRHLSLEEAIALAIST